jgi:hypothetical protein
MEHKQFGFWREHREDYTHFPNISEFVDKKINNSYSKERLISYLKSGGMVVVTSGRCFTNPFTKQKFSDSFVIRTDGVREWPEDLIMYIENYDVCIPDDWYEYIKSVDFKIPESIKVMNPEVAWDR